jgi:hypothetical protein
LLTTTPPFEKNANREGITARRRTNVVFTVRE